MNPYLIIGAVVGSLALAAASYGTGYHMRGVKADRDIAKLQLDARNAVIEFTAKSAAKDSANAEIARNVDAAYTAKIAAIESDRDSAADRYAKLLRRPAPVACSSSVPTAAADTGSGTGSRPSDNDGLSAEIGRDFATLGADANKLVEAVRACQAWGKVVGR